MKKLITLIKHEKYGKVIIGILVLLITLSTLTFYYKNISRIKVEDSLVDAPLISLTSTSSGKLMSVKVTDGQYVNKGDIVAIVGSEVVRAYTSGKVVNTNKQIGALVNSQTSLVQIVDTSHMRINGTIDENKGFNKIKVGMPVSFTVDALPGNVYWGYVDEVAESAKQTQAAFSISSTRPTQQFNVYTSFDASKYPDIKNGMSAKMIIYTE